MLSNALRHSLHFKIQFLDWMFDRYYLHVKLKSTPRFIMTSTLEKLENIAESKEDLNKRRAMPYSWVRKLSIIKMSVLP